MKQANQSDSPTSQQGANIMFMQFHKQRDVLVIVFCLALKQLLKVTVKNDNCFSRGWAKGSKADLFFLFVMLPYKPRLFPFLN